MLFNPDFGLVFWTTLSFILLLFLLGKFAWKPILQTIEKRNQEISEALAKAEQIRVELENFERQREQILQEARIERDRILAEARLLKEKMLEEANEKAKTEAQRIIESAYEEVQYQRQAMINSIKNEVALIALQIAEKIIQDHFKEDEKKRTLAYELAEKFNMN